MGNLPASLAYALKHCGGLMALVGSHTPAGGQRGWRWGCPLPSDGCWAQVWEKAHFPVWRLQAQSSLPARSSLVEHRDLALERLRCQNVPCKKKRVTMAPKLPPCTTTVPELSQGGSFEYLFQKSLQNHTAEFLLIVVQKLNTHFESVPRTTLFKHELHSFYYLLLLVLS